MERSRIPRLSEASPRNVLKIFAAFAIGVIAMFAGAVAYSRSHQSWPSVRAASTAPVERAHPVTQTQTPPPQPSSPPEQQTTTAVPQSLPASASGWEQVAQSAAPPEQTGESAAPAEQKQASPQPASAEAAAEPQWHDVPLPQRQLAPSPAPAEAQPMLLTLQPGLDIPVRLAGTLSSDLNRVGDSFGATLDAPVRAQGVVVAGSGAMVFGRISSVRKARLLGGKAQLTLTLTELTTRDGRRVRIESNEVELQGSRGGLVGTAKMATGAAVGAVVGALKGAAEGAGIGSSLRADQSMSRFAAKRTATLPAGTEITFKLAAPVRVAGQASR